MVAVLEGIRSTDVFLFLSPVDVVLQQVVKPTNTDGDQAGLHKTVLARLEPFVLFVPALEAAACTDVDARVEGAESRR